MEDQLKQLFFKLAALEWLKVIGIGLIAAAVYYPFYDDGKARMEELAQLQGQVVQTEKEINSVKEALANADRFEREVKDTVDQFTRIVDFMPTKVTTSMLTATISETCTKAGLRLLKIEPKDGPERFDFYEATRVAFSIEGTFTQVVSFLSSLSRVPRMMNFEGLALNAVEGSTDMAPRLVVSGLLVGFRYIPSELVNKNPSQLDSGATDAASSQQPQ